MSHIAATQAARTAGVTYRQLDYWTTNRYIRTNIANPGHGHPRGYTSREVHILTLMAGLVREGVEPRTASKVARQIVTRGAGRLGRFTITEGGG